MAGRRVWVAAVLACLAAVTPASAGSAPAPATSVRALTDARREAPAPRAGALLARAVAAMQGQADAAQQRGPAPAEDAAEESSEEVPVYTPTVVLSDVGDLDGDGVTDILTDTAAVSGSDGRLLWRGEGAARFQPAHTDLDGVTGDDLLTLDLLRHEVRAEECGTDPDWGEGCFPTDVLVTWRIGVASGLTGTSLWTHDIEGSYMRQREGTTTSGSDSKQWDSYAVYPQVLHSAAGASVAVVRERTENVRAWTEGDAVLGESSQRESNRITVTVDRFRARDGAENGALVLGPWHARRAAVDIVDLNADGTDELLVTADTREDSTATCTRLIITTLPCTNTGGEEGLSTSVVDILDGTAVWTETVAGGTCCWLYGYTYPVGDDLDGDGTEELARWYLSFGDVAGSDRLVRSVLSGSTGRVLYDVPGAGYVEPVLADLDGDGGNDFIVASYDSDALHVTRRNGRNAGLLSETVYSPSPEAQREEWFYADVVADVDGDGARDVLVMEESVIVQDNQPQDEAITWTAESGRSRAVLWRLGSPEAQGLQIIADADGADGADALVSAEMADGSVLSVRHGGEGALRWTRMLAGYSWAFALDDVDGDGTTDIAVVSDLDSGQGLTVLRGATGTPVWTVAIPEFVPPPPPSDQGPPAP